MIVYKATNTKNGKMYVGFTSKSLNHRKKVHGIDSKSGKNANTKFYRAAKKYGWDSFVWEILERCEDIDSCREAEIRWIKDLDVVKNGYNISEGGRGGDNYKNHPHMDIVRKTISDAVKNSVRWTPEKRKIQSDISRVTHKLPILKGDKNPMRNPETARKIALINKGKSPSDEARRNMSKAQKGRVMTQEAKDKMKYERENYVYVKMEYGSGKFLGIYTSPELRKDNISSSSIKRGYKRKESIVGGYNWIIHDVKKSKISKEELQELYRKGLRPSSVPRS